MGNRYEFETTEEALSLVTYEIGRIGNTIGDISSLLHIVIERLEEDEDTSFYGDALHPIAMMLLELHEDAYKASDVTILKPELCKDSAA